MQTWTLQSHTVREKVLEGENFGEFGKWLYNLPNFPHQYI